MAATKEMTSANEAAHSVNDLLRLDHEDTSKVIDDYLNPPSPPSECSDSEEDEVEDGAPGGEEDEEEFLFPKANKKKLLLWWWRWVRGREVGGMGYELLSLPACNFGEFKPVTPIIVVIILLGPGVGRLSNR